MEKTVEEVKDQEKVTQEQEETKSEPVDDEQKEEVEDEETKAMKLYNSTECPQSYMLMFNVQKQKNFGNLVRSAAAFNVNEVFIVDGGAVGKSKKKMRTFGS